MFNSFIFNLEHTSVYKSMIIGNKEILLTNAVIVSHTKIYNSLP